MRTKILFIVMALIGASVSLDGFGEELQAKLREPSPATLLKSNVPGVEGKDWNVITVELQPGAAQSWHVSPADELVYVLEGAGQLDLEGRPSVTLKPGAVAALGSTPNHLLRNTSRTKTLKVLVVLLIDKGQQHPLLALPSNGTGKQQLTSEPAKSPEIGLVF